MKKYSYIVALLMAVVVFAGCENYETYSDMKKKEQDAIEAFISEQGIQVIDQTTFEAQGNKTDLASNQFVKFTRNGVYMQIVREGCGDMIKDGESLTIDCRFTEFDILNDTSTIYNTTVAYASMPDRMAVTRTSGTYTASFISGLMTNVYSTSVPAGWLVPFSYIKVGRPQSMTEECAKVRLIVPHTQGHAYASSNVCPYFYTITFQREL